MPALDEASVRARFEATSAYTVGLEEEVLLLDHRTHLPVPVADEVVRTVGDERLVKRELPACQVELLTEPHADVAAAMVELETARATLLAACGESVAPAAAAVHPTAPATDAVGTSERHRSIEGEYGEIARRQMVGALQVHVALGSADRSLAVYNALRGYLPELAALAASAPFYEGRDTGLASVRPVICGQLPRQGVPPVIESWSAFVEELQWGLSSGNLVEPGRWWWELRPHLVHGTLEVRVPDVQATLRSTGAVAQVVVALVRHLGERHDDGEDLGAPRSWRIAENRWCALRDGVRGHLSDLETGESVPTSQRLHRLIDAIESYAPGGLDPARALVERNGAEDLRSAGLDGATRWLVESFPEGVDIARAVAP